MATQPLEPQIDDGKVLTSAVSKIAGFWGFTNAKLGTILGLSEATASRLRSGKAELDPTSKSFEAGQFLEPLLFGEARRQTVGRDPMLRFNHAPHSATVAAKLRRERGGRPHSRTR